MKKFFLFLMLLPTMAVFASCDFHDKMVDSGDLPTKTTQFIADMFPGCNVVAIDKDRDLGVVTYDVVLSCGVKLEFNSDGEWTEVDCDPESVPDAIVPEKILNYVQSKYAEYFIVKIEKYWNRYKVELNVDIDLVFDRDGNFVRIDN